MVYHAHQSDGEALSVFAVRIECFKVTLQHTVHSRGAQAPLLVYHATLLVNLLGVEGKPRRPVTQYEQTAVERALTAGRHIVDVVNGLVDTGIGIQVGAKFHTNAATILYQGVALEVVAAVESHVLKEVGQSALTLVFLYRAHLLRDVEVGTMLRPVIIPDIIGKAITQFTHTGSCIHGHCGHLLSRQCSRNSQQHG